MTETIEAPAREPVEPHLRADEHMIRVVPANLRVRGAPQALSTEGRPTTEPGLLAMTDRRILFIGHRGGRLVVDTGNVRSCRVKQRADGGRDLSVRMPGGGTAAIHVAGPALNGVSTTTQAPAAAFALRRQSALELAAPVLAAAVWGLSLSAVDPNDVGALGLVSALPAAAILALVLLCVGFARAITRPAVHIPTLALYTLALVFMLHGAGSLIEQVPSFNVTWRHAGIADYIALHGGVDPSLNAYFNWPGFFALTAVTRELAGVDGTVDLARWAPLVFNLLYLPPILVIARSVSNDRRLPWAAAWIFYLANWVNQDYLSPQGLVLLLYLTFAAVMLRWLDATGRSGAGPRQRAAFVVVCFLLLLAAVPSHQLTPFAMLAAGLVLVLVGATSARALPAIAAVLTLGWLVFAAAPYLSGHIADLEEDLGRIGSTISSNVSSRVSGSSEHTLIAYLRIAFAATIWALAALAALRALRRRDRRWLPIVGLAVAPFSLVLLQAYGGEILLRVYLFSLPFAAVLAASLLFADRDRTFPASAVVVAVASLAMAGMFLFTRYGNEQVNLFTPEEVRLVERVQDEAPPDAVVMAPNTNLPWESARVGEIRYETLATVLRRKDRSHLADAVAADMQTSGASAGYLLITANTREDERMFGAYPWGTIAELERSLDSSPSFRLVAANEGGRAYELATMGEGGGT